MYRTTIDEKEIIITLAPKIRKEITDRNPLYEAVLHTAARLLQTKQPTFAVNHEVFGLIIGEVQRGEVTVFAVEHIIPKQNIFGSNNFFSTIEQQANL
ncbi:cytoplasmic protein [Bacillus mobilis]|uniref:Cytoplasmic protein n=2 Tax=Bacillus cereus group TaxID=86661 RepID=A0A1C4BC49_BACCE|nr:MULTISPECIES: cytoplasmic protein [Bacillus cereus group]MCC2458911.1 cytoplasmic protein [Bacillus mobilis]MCU5432734.1 cytoplasmic protein [Bacillus mobilis]MCU5591316.1 cytoplasmic protein [Bacillus mobilis]MCU5735583.1 cytoplasmic protein [Bacillus mobilis]MCU9557487.1 cytoplasmic protein [Bacillus mobilis]